MRHPYFWRDGWYVKVIGANGKRTQKRLADTKEEAYHVWHLMQTADESEEDEFTVLAVASLFLEWSEAHQDRKTYRWYLGYLGPFCAMHGQVSIRELKPYHMTTWLDASKFKVGAKRAAISAVKRSLNWAVTEGRIPLNPLHGIKRPGSGRREQLVSADMHTSLMAATDAGRQKQYRRGAFRLFLAALRQSGARPGDVSEVEAQHVSLANETWTLSKHKTDATGRKKVIHLSPCLLTITRILVAVRPTGKLFLNADGEPWTPNAIRCRMRRLREKLGLPDGTVAYSYRHTFTTDGLVKGVDEITMAELLGHRDTSMIGRHYAHLSQRSEHMKAAIRKATG